MKVVLPAVEMPQPIKITVGEENLFPGAALKPGEYWLMFVSPVGIDLFTEEQFAAKYEVEA